MRTFKLAAIASIAVAAIIGLAWAGAIYTLGPVVMTVNHEQVAAAFAKGGVLLEGTNYKVQAGRREAPGQVEIHELDTDIFHVLEGTATLVTGGTATETNTISAHEIRGKAIQGGQSHKLSKGDVIVIPNGVPHWFTEASGPFLYFVVKVNK